MRIARIWPGTPDRVPCGMFRLKDQWHVVAAMTTDEHGVITKLAACCGASTATPALWTNLATVRAGGKRVCEHCAEAAAGTRPSALPPTLPDRLVEMLRQQAKAEGQSPEQFTEQLLTYRRRQNSMRIAASGRGKRKG